MSTTLGLDTDEKRESPEAPSLIETQRKFIDQFIITNNKYIGNVLNDTLVPMVFNMFKNDVIIDIAECESKLSKIDLGVLTNYCGMYYYFKKNYDMSHELFCKSVCLGDSGGMFNIGNSYNFGKGQDHKMAVNWFRQSAALGHSHSMYALGGCYFNGNGVASDHKVAVDWYRKSAVLGNSFAMNDLANRYYLGEGVEQDYKMAVEWYRKSADLGFACAMKNLGECYRDGRGVVKDLITAIKWFKLASDKGNSEADNNLSKIMVNDIVDQLIAMKKRNEYLVKINEHVTLFPGTSYEEAEADFLRMNPV